MWITNYHFFLSLSVFLTSVYFLLTLYIYSLAETHFFYFIMYMYSHCVGSITVDLMYPYISSSHLHYFMCNTRYYYFIVLCSINLILFVLLIFADLVLGFSHHLPFFMNFICFCCVLLVCIKAFCDHVDNYFYSHLIRYNDIQ